MTTDTETSRDKMLALVREIRDVLQSEGFPADSTTMEALDELEEAIEDQACTECGAFNDDGEGWDGLCGNCADREAANEEKCEACGQIMEPDWVEPHVHYSEWTGPLVGKHVEIENYRGIAFVVTRHSTETEEVIAVMVGDDRDWRFPVTDVTELARQDFCGECGQIGCTHDGLDRPDA